MSRCTGCGEGQEDCFNRGRHERCCLRCSHRLDAFHEATRRRAAPVERVGEATGDAIGEDDSPQECIDLLRDALMSCFTPGSAYWLTMKEFDDAVMGGIAAKVISAYLRSRALPQASAEPNPDGGERLREAEELLLEVLSDCEPRALRKRLLAWKKKYDARKGTT